jgi:hypothetical protein
VGKGALDRSSAVAQCCAPLPTVRQAEYVSVPEGQSRADKDVWQARWWAKARSTVARSTIALCAFANPPQDA